MFLRKKKYPYRCCSVYISEVHQQILFVPYGKTTAGFHVELNNIIVDTWPCKFQHLQTNIEEAFNRYQLTAAYDKNNNNWHSFNHSQAKTPHAFETNYINIHLSTDVEKEYGSSEKERINVSAKPTVPDTTYSLTGCSHLHETRIAQITLDIYNACLKIRS